jgi:hypothetical protein
MFPMNKSFHSKILILMMIALLMVSSKIVFAGVSERQADTLSFETPRPVEDVFKAAKKALKALEIKVVMENKYFFIRGEDSISRITRLIPVAGGGMKTEGISTFTEVNIWLVFVSQKETQVLVIASKTNYELSDKGKKLISVNRQEDLEQQIQSQMEQILAK